VDRVGDVLQLVGAALVVAAAWAVWAPLGLLAGGMVPGWELLLAPLFEALLWPVITAMLLAPQRRPPDPDQNRPL
jgi:rod shape-determining protein MreD